MRLRPRIKASPIPSHKAAPSKERKPPLSPGMRRKPILGINAGRDNAAHSSAIVRAGNSEEYI